MAKRILIGLIAVCGALLAVFLIWASDEVPADAEAMAALRSDDSVTVASGRWTVFTPTGPATPRTGVIFYPGGKADPRGYAPLLRAIAARGYLVACANPPLNLALLAPNRAQEAPALFPAVDRWVIGGHSLGGVFAVSFAASNPDRVAGLFLWASYPAGTDDLSGSTLPTLSVFASADTLTTADEVDAGRALLPPDTRYVTIDGADHFQFGSFVDAPITATLPRSAQQQAIVEATVAFLEGLPDVTRGGGPP
jgi:pimeloyl-ACP methyl ester carboxylesterase